MAGLDQSPPGPMADAPPRQRSIAPTPTRIYNSHQVNPDHSITFRLDAPNAHAVDLVTDITPDVLPLMKGPDGLWSVTTSPLPPSLYSYAFSIDGVDQADPRNSSVKLNLVSSASLVLIPGEPAKPWEPAPVPHGTVHNHVYTTAAVEGLSARQSRYVVYTPPGYDCFANRPYPVLYLLHGWSDSEISWTQIGQAHFVLDALIASGEAKPMIIVMPLGYGQMSFVEEGIGVWQTPVAITAKYHAFSAGASERNPACGRVDLYRTLRPTWPRHCRTVNGRAAVAPDRLESYGQICMDWRLQLCRVDSRRRRSAETLRGNLNSSTAKPSLIWMSCGAADPFLDQNRRVIAWLKQRSLSVTAVESAGGHTWTVWREDLIRILPFLFTDC